MRVSPSCSERTAPFVISTYTYHPTHILQGLHWLWIFWWHWQSWYYWFIKETHFVILYNAYYHSCFILAEWLWFYILFIIVVNDFCFFFIMFVPFNGTDMTTHSLLVYAQTRQTRFDRVSTWERPYSRHFKLRLGGTSDDRFSRNLLHWWNRRVTLTFLT